MKVSAALTVILTIPLLLVGGMVWQADREIKRGRVKQITGDYVSMKDSKVIFLKEATWKKVGQTKKIKLIFQSGQSTTVDLTKSTRSEGSTYGDPTGHGFEPPSPRKEKWVMLKISEDLSKHLGKRFRALVVE